MVFEPHTGHEVILAAFIATVSAQICKIIWHLLFNKRFNFRIILHTGGMPSSHSACMTALATSVGILDGFNSVTFAIALGLACVVMYDAAGVRQAAGKMAGILNRLTEDLYKNHPESLPERLRELLGHTPREVLVGCLWGISVAIWLNIYLNQHMGVIPNAG